MSPDVTGSCLSEQGGKEEGLHGPLECPSRPSPQAAADVLSAPPWLPSTSSPELTLTAQKPQRGVRASDCTHQGGRVETMGT